MLQREIQNIQEQELKTAERLLTKSQLYYSEAIIRHQEDLLRSRQSLPSDPESEKPEAQ